MSEAHEDEYEAELIDMLELIWGKGFLSPGGADAVRRIIRNIPLSNMKVLDIGSGIGGASCLMAGEYGADVTGIDIEDELVKRSKAYVVEQGLTDKVEIQKVAPGPLPFADNQFDVVFGKDAWLHIEDKLSFFIEVFRVLKPGGQVVCGDWLGGYEARGEDFAYFLELEGISYHLVTLEEYKDLLSDAGFTDVWGQSIWEEYRAEAQVEYEKMQTSLFQPMTELVGSAVRDKFIENWRMLTVVLNRGDLRPALACGTKPSIG